MYLVQFNCNKLHDQCILTNVAVWASNLSCFPDKCVWFQKTGDEFVSFDEDKNWENFLLEVAEKRQEQGMTHKDLADNAGTVERTISRLLSEPTKNPSLFLVASVCQALHISLDKHFVKEVYTKTDSQSSEEMIEVLKEQVRQRRKLSKTLFAVIFVLLAMMILYLVLIDANNLNYGLIRD